jgi:hypothetical protein
MQVAADPRTGCRTVSHIVGIAVDQRNGKAGIPAITLLADFMEKLMFVYFVQAGLKGPIKIGMARSVSKRLETMQTGNAYKLHVLALIPCQTKMQAAEIEKRLHRLFFKQRIRGEWFTGNIKVKKATDWYSGEYLEQQVSGLV